MQELQAAIHIQAPAATVWQALMGLAAYPDWNPFLRTVTGDLGVGGQLTIGMYPPAVRPLRLQGAVLRVEPEHELVWRARLWNVPRLLEDEHAFRLASPTPNSTQLQQIAQVSGLLTRLPLSAVLLRRITQGMDDMNLALKDRAVAMGTKG